MLPADYSICRGFYVGIGLLEGSLVDLTIPR
jgi:hypothetical protein